MTHKNSLVAHVFLPGRLTRGSVLQRLQPLQDSRRCPHFLHFHGRPRHVYDSFTEERRNQTSTPSLQACFSLEQEETRSTRPSCASQWDESREKNSRFPYPSEDELEHCLIKPNRTLYYSVATRLACCSSEKNREGTDG
jgi:hypothetical protein